MSTSVMETRVQVLQQRLQNVQNTINNLSAQDWAEMSHNDVTQVNQRLESLRQLEKDTLSELARINGDKSEARQMEAMGTYYA